VCNWSLTLGEGKKLRMLKERALRRIFGLKDEREEGWR
jgi:hypothetical protein